MSLTATTLTATEETNLAAAWEQAKRDPLCFLEEFVFTCDQHDKDSPIKRFPIQRPHLQAMVGLWLDNPLLAVKKSRQLIQTWLFVALGVWDWLFHDGRLIMFQSKREEDAVGDAVAGDGLLGRGRFIMDHLPARSVLVPDYVATYNKMRLPSRNSTIWAIPQGANIIRQRTASGILSDEAAFQDQFGDAYTAAMPCIRGGGWVVALSSAHPGFFERLHGDTLSEGE